MTNTTDKIYISILGMPGSGKGTQISLLSKEFKTDVISIGEMVRDKIENSSNIKSNSIRDKYNEGIPQSDELILVLVEKKINRSKKDIIFDNYPFSLKQANHLDELLSKNKIINHLVINLKISDKTSFERIEHRVMCKHCMKSYVDKNIHTCPSCGQKLIERLDDRDSVVRKRIIEYKKRIDEMKKHYQQTDHYLEIDGEKTIKKVYQELIKSIYLWKSFQRQN